jgi:hypothetical protein
MLTAARGIGVCGSISGRGNTGGAGCNIVDAGCTEIEGVLSPAATLSSAPGSSQTLNEPGIGGSGAVSVVSPNAGAQHQMEK